MRVETREWTKGCTGPLPTISQELADTKCAVIFWSGINGLRIPALEIEVSGSLRGCHIAPRILPVIERWAPIRGTVKLLLSSQALTNPSGVRLSFQLRNVDWPIKRQRYLFEHSGVVK